MKLNIFNKRFCIQTKLSDEEILDRVEALKEEKDGINTIYLFFNSALQKI